MTVAHFRFAIFEATFHWLLQPAAWSTMPGTIVPPALDV